MPLKLTIALMGAAAIVIGSNATAHGNEITIDFDEFTFPLSTLDVTGGFQSQGFTFSLGSPGGLLLVADRQTNIPDTGSNTVITNENSSLLMTETSGATFDLISFLGAEGRNINSGFFPEFGSTQISVLGTKATGENVSTIFDLDIFAEENDALDFELFTLNGFSNLVSAEFSGLGGGLNGYSASLDNIVVRTPGTVESIPEPAASLGLLVVGAAAAGSALRKKSVA